MPERVIERALFKFSNIRIVPISSFFRYEIVTFDKEGDVINYSLNRKLLTDRFEYQRS